MAKEEAMAQREKMTEPGALRGSVFKSRTLS